MRKANQKKDQIRCCCHLKLPPFQNLLNVERLDERAGETVFITEITLV